MIGERSQTITLYITFLDVDGTESMIIGTPTIEIYNMKNGEAVEALEASDMILIEGSTYGYPYYVPGNAPLGTYTCKFRGTYSDLTNVVSEDTFTIMDKGFATSANRGGGTVIRREVSSDNERQIDKLGEYVREGFAAIERVLTHLTTRNDEMDEKLEEIANKSPVEVKVDQEGDTLISRLESLHKSTTDSNDIIHLDLQKLEKLEDINRIQKSVDDMNKTVELLRNRIDTLDDMKEKQCEIEEMLQDMYLRSMTNEELGRLKDGKLTREG